MLVERDELTSGSTSHAAGLLPYFNMSYATTHIHDHSLRLYKALEEETGLDPGFSVVGNLRMAIRERMDEYMLYATTAETCGAPYEWLTPADIRDRWPLVRTEDREGAIYHPTDDPADVTQALARGARNRGVAIERRWQVDACRRTGDAWVVTLTKTVERGGNLVPSEEQVEVTTEHGRQIGMGYVAPDNARPGTRLSVRMLARLWPAEVVADSPWDAQNAALRGDG